MNHNLILTCPKKGVPTLLFVLYCGNLFSQTTPTNPNIILIVMDDMNDYVSGLNGHPQANTPNIQKISKFGTTFTNAFCNSTTCTPSRFSYISGKDVSYTQVYNNNDVNCNNFRANFKHSYGNKTVFTIPEILKDSAGYYTINISKVMACHENMPDYDMFASDNCERGLSWSDYKTIFDGAEMPDVHTYGLSVSDGISDFNFAPIPDELESSTLDYITTDTAIAFINDYFENPENYCDKHFLWRLVIGDHIRNYGFLKNIFYPIIMKTSLPIHFRLLTIQLHPAHLITE